jgi:hypothetical protein
MRLKTALEILSYYKNGAMTEFLLGEIRKVGEG